MNRLARVLEEAARRLHDSGHAFALVGGIAVSVRTEPRFTRDVDLAVAVDDDADAEAVVRGFAEAGIYPVAVVEHDFKKRLATARMAHRGQERAIVTDLLFASSGIERDVALAAEPIEAFAGVIVPVASVGHLIALKLLAEDVVRRPQDRVDLSALLEVASAPDLGVAREAVALIEARGFHRGRDLAAALTMLISARGNAPA